MSMIFFSLLCSILLHWESTTPGFGWSEPVNISNMSGSDDAPCIAVYEDTLHVVWQGGLTGEGFQIYYNRCINGEWEIPTNVSNADWWCMMPSIIIDHNSVIHAVWAGYSGIGGDAEIYHVIKEYGFWSGPRNISDSPDANNRYPRLAVDSENSVHLVYEHQGMPGCILYQRKSDDEWTVPQDITQDIGENDYCPVIVLDNCGRPHVAWYVTQHKEVYYSMKVTGGWTSPENISEEPGYSLYPKLAVDRRNRVHLVWEGGLQEYGIREPLYRFCINNDWSIREQVNPDGGSEPALVIDNDDIIHTVWRGPNLLYSCREDGEWSYPDTINMDSAFWPDLAVDGNNSLHCVYSYGHEIYYTFKQGPGSTGEVALLVIEPDSSHVVIPPEGGNFRYTLVLENLTDSVQEVEVWIAASLPDGEEYGPIFGPREAVLTPFEIITRDVVQHVPGAAPYGAYCYHGYVAGSGSGDVLGQSHVRVVKMKR